MNAICKYIASSSNKKLRAFIFVIDKLGYFVSQFECPPTNNLQVIGAETKSVKTISGLLHNREKKNKKQTNKLTKN